MTSRAKRRRVEDVLEVHRHVVDVDEVVVEEDRVAVVDSGVVDEWAQRLSHCIFCMSVLCMTRKVNFDFF